MIGKLVLIVTFLLFPLVSRAEPESGVLFKGGPDVATLTYDNRVNRYGFSGGLAGQLQWSLSDHFSLGTQVELLYTARGAEVVIDDVPAGKTRLHYLDIVIAARPELQFGAVSGYLLLGGGLNLLTSANNQDAIGGPRDITDDLHRIDVALLAGVGVSLSLPHRDFGPVRLGTLFLEARHDRGLLDIDTMDLGFKNRTSSLMLGLSLALGARKADGKATSPPAQSDPPPPAAAAVLAE